MAEELKFAELKKQYSLEEAKAAIDEILKKYGDTVRITFYETYAEIVDSYLVEDVNVHHVVCEIIVRTGVTKRSYHDLAAEWKVHNASYQAGFMRDHAKDVALDYKEDPHLGVQLATKVFQKLNLE